MKKINEQEKKTKSSGLNEPGMHLETDGNYQEMVEKGYFSPATGEWDYQKLEKDGIIKSRVEPKVDEPKEPVTVTPVEPAIEPVTIKKEPEEVDTKELETLSEQLNRMKKLMGM
jgi:hypothetical protein|tara:strand:- start:15099 stop:15440 length:342 start_codon:yes stop_codon:yes gene_type:complete